MPDSRDFSTVLVKDDRLMISDTISYGVQKGAQQISAAIFEATSESPSSHVYNVVVPSLETIVDRHVLWQSTVTLRINATVDQNFQAVNIGVRDSLGPFPLHSLVSSMSCTINNNTVSVNLKETLGPTIRLLDQREIEQYSGSTPTAFDTYLNYADMIAGASNNVFRGYDSSSPDGTCMNRGAFALDSVTQDPGGTVMSVAAAAGPKVCYVKFTVSEPLMISPFLFSKTSNNGGLYGIQNMSFQMNIMSDAKRAWKHMNAPVGEAARSTITSIEVFKFESSRLTFNFLTPHASDVLPARCVVPYYEMPRYLSTNYNAIPAATAIAVPGRAINPGKSPYQSTTISLNQIPDKLIIFAKKRDQSWTDTDSYLTIDKISMNFNNSSGLLSSFSQYQLWRMSVEAGSNQTWAEFRGYAYKASGVAETTAGAGAGSFVATTGSILVLDMAKDIQLVQDFYAPGSIGNFNLQFELSCKNYSDVAITPEICVIAINSGLFACERGTSSVYSALLTKQDVLEASMQQPISRSDVRRMVGGGFLDSLKSAWKWLTHDGRLGKVANTALNVHDIYKGGPSSSSTKARHVVHALGGARSGGAMSGGSLSERLR